MSKTILAIDIGSTKICAVTAQINEENSLTLTGAGVVKSQGIKKGSITNIELASKSIKKAVEDAKRVSGSSIKSAIVSISGAYTKSSNSKAIVNIQTKEISLKDIQRVMKTSLYNANIPNEHEVLHVLPYNFKVDEQDFIEDPLGMNASRLEVDTHIITTQKSNLNNLKKAVNGAGIEVENVVLNSYASSISTLNDDEKELGVVLIDMGGHTSNMVIHSGNGIRYNDFLGVGSYHVTNDISMAFHTPLSMAENVKINYASLLEPTDALIELPVIGDEANKQEVSLEIVHNVIYARVEETLMILAQFIENSGLKEQIGAGIVLTGGFSKMEGIKELASATFGSIPVRLAKPVEIDGLFDGIKTPEFSTVIGLVKYSSCAYTPYEIDVNKVVRHGTEISNENTAINFKKEQEHHVVPSVADEVIQEDEKPQMVQIEKEVQKNKNDEAGALKKFMNWATQLF